MEVNSYGVATGKFSVAFLRIDPLYLGRDSQYSSFLFASILVPMTPFRDGRGTISTNSFEKVLSIPHAPRVGTVLKITIVNLNKKIMQENLIVRGPGGDK